MVCMIETDAIVTAIECSVCMDRTAGTALSCGHCFCCQEECGSSRVTTCPTCWKPVEARIRLFGLVQALTDIVATALSKPASSAQAMVGEDASSSGCGKEMDASIKRTSESAGGKRAHEGMDRAGNVQKKTAVQQRQIGENDGASAERRNTQQLCSAGASSVRQAVAPMRETAGMRDVAGIVTGMALNIGDAKAQRDGCTALHRLACSNRKTAVEIGNMALGQIFQAMERHKTDIEVQDAACDALHKVAARSRDNPQSSSAKIVRGGGIALILNAMACHADDSEIDEAESSWNVLQESACTILVTLLTQDQLHQSITQQEHERIFESVRRAEKALPTKLSHAKSARPQTMALKTIVDRARGPPRARV